MKLNYKFCIDLIHVVSFVIFRGMCFLCRSHFFLLLLLLSVFYISITCNIEYFLKARSGPFFVKNIIFDGNDKIPEVLLRKVSDVRRMTNMFYYSIEDIKRRLEGIAWVRSVCVQRKFPDKMYIKIVERTPIAFLQKNNKFFLVDSDGVVLENDGMGGSDDLPVIRGEDAEKDVAAFISFVNRYPKVKSQMVYSERISKRRWNIIINNGVVVKLPEKRVLNALEILNSILSDKGFLKDDIECLDMRLFSKVVVTRKISTLQKNKQA